MRRVVALVLALSLVGCSEGEAAPTSVVSSSTTAATSSTTMAASTTSSLPSFAADDLPALALYLAAIERGVAGTELEGAAFEEPEALVDTGILFCGLLDEGVAPVDVLRGWVAALSADDVSPDEDELLLGGVVLGAAVRFLCPEHVEALEL